MTAGRRVRNVSSVVGIAVTVAFATAAADQWYVVCEPGTGSVLTTDTVDGTSRQVMKGPLPGPRTATAWVEEHCPGRRCDASAECVGAATVNPEEESSGGWAAGELTTVVSGGAPVTAPSGEVATAPPGPQGPVRPGADPLEPLVETAKAAAAACSYPAALAAADHMTNFDPEHPWLEANHDTVKRLARRQKQTEQRVWRAASELERGELKRARELAFAATDTAVSCQSRVVSDLVSGIDTAIKQRSEMRSARNRRFAASLLPGLINLARVASGSQATPEATASAVVESLTSSATPGGAAAGVDPCAFRLEYDDPSTLVPVCTCPGYSFDARRFRCAR